MIDHRQKRYWQSPEERDGSEEFIRAAKPEFPEPLDVSDRGVGRRGFLKAAGFTLGGLVCAGCQRGPVHKAIPYLVQPEDVTPGRAYFYASTCASCTAGCGLLVKNRDGRPIKLEGNPSHPFSRGGLCAVGQASLLGLYDSQRLKDPLRDGKPATWPTLDAAVIEELAAIKRQGGKVRFLTGTVTSPTTRAWINRFLSQFSDGRHVVYDELSCSAILDAHEQTHGVRALPHYRFERAEVIVGFDADFLGTWISPVEFTVGYRHGRNLDSRPPHFAYHVQFESRMSVTGSKADRRIRITPGELGLVMTYLAAYVGEAAGMPLIAVAELAPPSVSEDSLNELAHRLWQARGRSVIVCGSQDIATQVMCNYLNHLLGNYGTTVDLQASSNQRQGNAAALTELLKELYADSVAALLVYGANPVYDLPGGQQIADAVRRVPLSVSFTERPDETTAAVKYVCPDHHYLESWSDVEAVSGIVGVSQPAISPMGNTRSVVESLATWMSAPRSVYDLLREHWQTEIFQRFKGGGPFQAFWDRAVHDGYVEVSPQPIVGQAFRPASVQPIRTSQPLPDGTLALVLYPKVAILSGKSAYNPWLQELPDPITKVTWDNYACLSPTAADGLGVQEGDIVHVTVAGQGHDQRSIELPVVIQPGQHDRVVAVALGYGCEASRRFGDIGPQWLQGQPTLGENGLVGASAAPLLTMDGGTLRYTGTAVALSRTGRQHLLARTQTYQSITVPERLAPRGMERRPNIRETTPARLHAMPSSCPSESDAAQEDLWPADHEYTGHRWAMVIDLTACTGCSACVIACQVENNVPVVGKDEVRRNRVMHWIRIDRYYAEQKGEVDVAYQPMLCQQCENAPCETVCPVLATVHSEEGLNQQVYNRCVGTRYCANNCPYKVRRFNWFGYAHNDKMQNLALNPDVTVRSRGVMEKCSFCSQRIQAAKLEAKCQGRPLADGDIQPACQQSCPAGAIVFGDMNDSGSAVSRLIKSGRHYRVLEEINVKPVVGYLSVVRNRAASEGQVDHE